MRLSILAAAILAFTYGCGGPQPGATTRASAPASVAAGCTGSGGTAVSVANFAYDPASVTVAVGGTVTWTNSDSETHTVTFDGGPDCGDIAQGASVSRTFDTAGSFGYICTIHPTMRGTVVVQ